MNDQYLNVKAEQRGPVCVLAVTGDLDVGSTARFAELTTGAITAMRPRPQRVVLDLSGLRFTDCGGARTLAAFARSAPGKCPVVVRSTRPAVRRVLDLLGLDLELMGPTLDLISLDVEHVRGSAEAVAESPTGVLVRQSVRARSWSQQTVADSRRMAEVIAETEDRMSASLIGLASRRPKAADRLTALSEAAHMQAMRLRDQARRHLPASD
jgi:anti-anti-sigma factor